MIRSIISILLLGLTFPLFSLKKNKTTDLEGKKYTNFLAAIQNKSTFSYFTVIRVKNLSSGMIKEICTQGNFVDGALHIELKADYNKEGDQRVLEFAKTKKDRYFEFKSKKALSNISFFEYNSKLIDRVRSMYNFHDVIDSIHRKDEFYVSLPDSEMKAFAHILFNKGYLTGENNCFGGTLKYVRSPKFGE